MSYNASFLKGVYTLGDRKCMLSPAQNDLQSGLCSSTKSSNLGRQLDGKKFTNLVII